MSETSLPPVVDPPARGPGLPAAAPDPARSDRPAAGLLGRLLAVYRPEPAQALLTDPRAVRSQYLQWRWRMFIGMFAGYAVLYFCRKNISTALPVMGTDLGYQNVQLGLIGTSLYVTYGIGKFLNGVLADRANIRTFMATALIVSGGINLLFGSVSTLWLLAFLWGLNGWFQSMGFPPIARGMTLWYPAQGKSTRWAFWTCSHQAGTALVMALTAWILTWGGWRWCFYLPAVLCIGLGLLLLLLMGDTPESRGLRSAEAFAGPAAREDEQQDYRTVFVRRVLLNRNVWAIGLVDLCVYVIRYGTLDWSTKYMIETKGYEVSAAAFRAGIMPLAGIAGVLLSGVIADVVFRGRYRAVNAVSLVGLAGSMFAFHWIGAGHPWLDLALLAAIGFFVEGPQSILGGVGAVDAGGSARVASAAAGLVGILAYTGASLSGVGTGLFIDKLGWVGAYGFWIACAVLGFVIVLVLWDEKKKTAELQPARA